jgi:hypothetical protein
MDVELNAHEARVLGVLIEKNLSTPDSYPLSLNGATVGCNQKSNRNPVVDFSEAEVTVAFTGLRMKHLAGSKMPAGSRVEKWTHTAKEHLRLGDHDLAVLAELLLRGPQSPGELRTRASRMRTLHNLEELSHVLNRLMDAGYVRRIPSGHGSRVERFAQTLAPGLHPDGVEDAPAAAPARTAPSPAAPSPAAPVPRADERLAGLERRVAELESQLRRLAEQLGESLGG